MLVKQIYNLVNDITNEVLGKEGILLEDLSNVVQVGDEVFNANAQDNYVRSLVNHIGRVVFVDRKYMGSAPKVLMDGWEFGSVLEKVTMELPQAEENESWELEDRTSYDPNIFYKPQVSAKFFNGRVTFEVPISITEKQVKESFSNAQQLNAFISMIYTAIENSLTLKIDGLIRRTINNFTAETLFNAYNSGVTFSGVGNTRAINLLARYNEGRANPLTSANALSDLDFLKFASAQMSIHVDRLREMSGLFNIGGKARFTPNDRLHVVMLSEFAKKADVYLQSDTYHNEFTRLPDYEKVGYWQGSGLNYDFADTSKINVKTSNNNSVEASGILCVMFDRDALGVSNVDRRTTTQYNGKAEFFNNWYKYDAGYFNDFNENFIVFFIADTDESSSTESNE